jgi:hypothetical protein
MVDYHQRDGVIPLLEAAQEIQRALPGFRSQHAVPLLVMPLQIALDGAKNIEIVVDGQDHWLLHIAITDGALYSARGPEKRDPSCGTSSFIP